MYFGLFGIAFFIFTLAYAAWIKNTKLVMGAILSLTAFMIYFSQMRTVMEIGSQVRVENLFGGYAEFKKDERIQDQVYLMVGPLKKPWGVSGYSTDVPVISMGNVEKLNEKFGDFRKCNSQGAAQALDSMVELKLIGADRTVVGQIQQSFEVAMKTNENVFIRLSGQSLTLNENKMKGRVPERDLSGPSRIHVLIQDLQYFKNNVR